MNTNPKGCDRAYAELLDYLLLYGLNVGSQQQSRQGFSTPMFYSTTSDFQENDLVVINATSNKEYRISWLKGQLIHPSGDREFLLQSAKTGNECWWSNAGIYVAQRKDVESHPEWKWTNEQWGFKDAWAKIQHVENEYSIRTHITAINGDVAEIKTRTRYSLDDLNIVTSFNWKEMSVGELVLLHRQIIKGHEDAQEEQRKQRDSQTPV